MLCWVHAGRPFKKLIPGGRAASGTVGCFSETLLGVLRPVVGLSPKTFLGRSLRLESEFDRLFSTHTGYDELDKRIAKTQAKKTSLLLVFKYPELPLHNNAAELGVSQRVRKRDVSFGPRTQDGVRAWDTFATLAATAKKLGVSFYRLSA